MAIPSEKLAEFAVQALQQRTGCLLQHHGMIVLGQDIEHAYWLGWELETLARQYHGCLQIGDPPLLSSEQIAEVAAKLPGYGKVPPIS